MATSASCSVTATAMASAVSNAAKLPTKGSKASNCNANQANQEQGREAPTVKAVLWDANAEEYIIGNWGQEYIRIRKGNLKDRHWVTIAEEFKKDQGPNKQHYLPKHCKSKIDSLKKRYKTEKKKKNATKSVNSSWPHFAKLNEILAINPKIVGISGGFDLGADVQPKDLRQPLEEEDEGGEEEHSGHLEKEPSLKESRLRMVALKMLLRATPMKESRMGQAITMLVLVKKF
jgi:hypothetical protein